MLVEEIFRFVCIIVPRFKFLLKNDYHDNTRHLKKEN